MLQTAIKEYLKKWIIACNIAISMIVAIFTIFGICTIFAYMPPKNLQETTGIIASYKQHDTEWYDYIGGFGTGSYMNVTFEDDTFFEAKGISYDNINRELFEIISVGEEIKIIYNSSFGRPNHIYAIEYNGVNYLLVDDVLGDYKESAKTMNLVGLITIVSAVVMGGIGLFFVNYKYRKKKTQIVQNPIYDQ